MASASAKSEIVKIMTGQEQSMPNVIMNADDALEMAVDEDVGSVHS